MECLCRKDEIKFYTIATMSEHDLLNLKRHCVNFKFEINLGYLFNFNHFGFLFEFLKH